MEGRSWQSSAVSAGGSVSGAAVVMRLLLSVLTLALSSGLLWAWPTVSQAANYHVAPGAAACTDARCSCSAEQPCGISPALARRLGPGDIVLIAPGRYPPLALRNVHGLMAAPIVFRGADAVNDQPVTIFEGKDTAKDVIELRESSYVEFQSIKVSGGQRAGFWINNSHSITLRDSLLSGNGVWGVFTNHANDVTVVDNRILGPASQHGIYLSNSGDRGRLLGNFISGFDGCAIQLNGDKRMAGAEEVIGDGVIEDVEIANNYLADSGRAGGAAINLDGARNTRVENNVVIANHSAAIAMFRIDGAVASRETRILKNLLVGTGLSRDLLVFGVGSRDNFVADNLLVSLNPDSAVFDIEFAKAPGLLARLRDAPLLPATFVANSYLTAGPLAVFSSAKGRDRDEHAMEAWVEVSGDSASRLLPIDARALEASDPVSRYARLAELVEQSGVLSANPFVSLLRSPQHMSMLD